MLNVSLDIVNTDWTTFETICRLPHNRQIQNDVPVHTGCIGRHSWLWGDTMNLDTVLRAKPCSSKASVEWFSVILIWSPPGNMKSMSESEKKEAKVVGRKQVPCQYLYLRAIHPSDLWVQLASKSSYRLVFNVTSNLVSKSPSMSLFKKCHQASLVLQKDPEFPDLHSTLRHDWIQWGLDECIMHEWFPFLPHEPLQHWKNTFFNLFKKWQELPLDINLVKESLYAVEYVIVF